MRDAAVVFEDVWKSYPSYTHVTGGIKGFLFHLPQALKGLRGRRTALEGLSFEIGRGENFGFIGHNGAGKSTILGLIAGVLSPDKGKVEVNDRVSPLLELGAGFHPELSGRVNILLNGVLLGLTREEVLEHEEKIIEFAGLGEFIDMPVRTYSSGMYAKLGFSVVANLKPEILLLDEILAVGDITFQHKCKAVFEEFRKKPDVTMVLVSHSLDNVVEVCDRAAWIEGKKVRMIGEAKEVVAAYKAVNERNSRGCGVTLEREAIPAHIGTNRVELNYSDALGVLSPRSSKEVLRINNQAVLLTTYPEAFLHKGGGEYELLDIAHNLRKLGLVADVYSPFSKSLANYGTVIHFSVNASGLPIVEAVKNTGKKLILWPNFWTSKVAANENAIATRLADLADIIVFKSHTEKTNFENVVSIYAEKALIIPTAVAPIFIDSTPENLFRKSFDLNEYLVWVGIFEPRKNQLGVINVLRDLELPIVFIGNYRDEAYYRACKAAAPDHFMFLEPMEQASDILRAAIRESRLYLEPTLEPAGKSVIEAAISGARVLVADQPWEREHLGRFAVYVNPKDAASIREGVRLALTTPVDPEQVQALAQKHLMPQVLDRLVSCISETA